MQAIKQTISKILGKPVNQIGQSEDLLAFYFERQKYTPNHVIAITNALNEQGIRTLVTRRKECGRVSSTLVVELL